MSTYIAATGTAETQVPPDRATLTIVIRTAAPTSLHDAARQMAPIERAVLDALARAGVARECVSTVRYDTGRERLYQREQWVHGEHYVDHVLSADVERLETLGAAVAAARQAGATRIAGIHFWLSDDEAHREAMTREAVAQAIARARTLAESAGARLGRVVRLGTPEALAATLGAASTESGGIPPVRFMASAAPGYDSAPDDVAEPLILPVPITVAALVHGAWEAVPEPAPEPAPGAPAGPA